MNKHTLQLIALITCLLGADYWLDHRTDLRKAELMVSAQEDYERCKHLLWPNGHVAQDFVDCVNKQPSRRFVPDCEHLYDNGNSKAWAACMGVPYR